MDKEAFMYSWYLDLSHGLDQHVHVGFVTKVFGCMEIYFLLEYTFKFLEHVVIFACLSFQRAGGDTNVLQQITN